MAEKDKEKPKEEKKEKKVTHQGKKSKKNKPTSKKYKFYKVEGDKLIRERNCPRCGPGVFLARTKAGDRLYCGKCQYTEFLEKPKQTAEKVKEEKTEKPKEVKN